MADSTVNDTPDGFDNAVTAMREVMRRDNGTGCLARVSLTHRRGEGWQVEAQCWAVGDERESIDVLRTWADALGGELTLSESRVSDYGTHLRRWRQLAANATIAGVAVEIWNHIDIHETPVEQAPEMAAAHA